MTMMAVNNRVRKLLTSLFLVSSGSLMAGRRAVFGRLVVPRVFRALFCCRPTPSVRSGLAEVYLIESGRRCRSLQNQAGLKQRSNPPYAPENSNVNGQTPGY